MCEEIEGVVNYFQYLQEKYPSFDPNTWIAPTFRGEFYSLNFKKSMFKSEPFHNVTVFTSDRIYKNVNYYHESFKERYFVDESGIVYKGKPEYLYLTQK